MAEHKHRNNYRRSIYVEQTMKCSATHVSELLKIQILGGTVLLWASVALKHQADGLLNSSLHKKWILSTARVSPAP